YENPARPTSFWRSERRDIRRRDQPGAGRIIFGRFVVEEHGMNHGSLAAANRGVAEYELSE
ncbi:hypothetical protein ACQ3WR_004988, partial [Escherichia coli]